jgi:hypothetical protein
MKPGPDAGAVALRPLGHGQVHGGEHALQGLEAGTQLRIGRQRLPDRDGIVVLAVEVEDQVVVGVRLHEDLMG